MNVRRLIAPLAVLLMAVALTGCPPRGETRTLAEVLANSKARFSAVKVDGLPDGVAQAVGSITAALETMIGSSDPVAIASTSAGIAETLAGLTLKAGFTSRPAMGELAAQFRTIGAGGAQVASNNVQLLASRTFTVLAAELETTRFGL